MKPTISIILPAIRKDNWDALYNSISLACKKHSFEVIFCGPLSLTEKLQSLPNVKYVKDLGSPTRASNIACLMAEGELLTWIADDGVMIEDSLDKNIELLRSMGSDVKNVVVVKYYEGSDRSKKNLQQDSYFYLGNTCLRSRYVNPLWLMYNNPIMYRAFYDKIGGLDCSFQSCPMAHIDFGIKCQFFGANTKLSEFYYLDVGHMENTTGDHKPIHISQKNFDEPLLFERYNAPNWPDAVKIFKNDSWKEFPSIWTLRFKNGVPKDYQTILKENDAHETP